MNKTSKFLIALIFLGSLTTISPSAYATDCTSSSDCPSGEVCSNQECTDDKGACKDNCDENYNCGDLEGDAKKDCRAQRTDCKNECRTIGDISPSSGLSGEDLIDELVPSQGSLFGYNTDLSLTNGDLEQEIAPQLLKLLVQFSSLLGFILFTYMGIRLVLARSDEEAYTKAKSALVHTFVGAIIIAGSFGIVVAILQIFNSL